jgi:hypothetical protein
LTSEHQEAEANSLDSAACTESRGEAKRKKAQEGATIRTHVWGRLDPVVSRIASWSDEDPRAMLRLLDDAELRSQLRSALLEIVPGTGADSANPSAAAGA